MQVAEATVRSTIHVRITRVLRYRLASIACRSSNVEYHPICYVQLMRVRPLGPVTRSTGGQRAQLLVRLEKRYHPYPFVPHPGIPSGTCALH